MQFPYKFTFTGQNASHIFKRFNAMVKVKKNHSYIHEPMRNNAVEHIIYDLAQGLVTKIAYANDYPSSHVKLPSLAFTHSHIVS